MSHTTGIGPGGGGIVGGGGSLVFISDPDTDPSEVQVGELITFELPDGDTKGVLADAIVAEKPGKVNLDMRFVVLGTGGAGQNIRLRAQARYIGIGEQADKAIDETVLLTVPVPNVQDEVFQAVMPFDRTLIEKDDIFNIVLERLGNDGADTFTGDVGLVDKAIVRAI